MRKFKALAAAALLTFTGAAYAGEPFHPIYQPIIDFFAYVSSWF